MRKYISGQLLYLRDFLDMNLYINSSYIIKILLQIQTFGYRPSHRYEFHTTNTLTVYLKSRLMSAALHVANISSQVDSSRN